MPPRLKPVGRRHRHDGRAAKIDPNWDQMTPAIRGVAPSRKGRVQRSGYKGYVSHPS